MKLTRNKLFIGILSFLIVVNLLVIFNLDFFYIRVILAFIFLITIPGLLIMLCFKIREIGFWEYLVYVVGLSVAFIMFAGLHANWTLPALGITDKPLSTIPVLVEFDIFLLILSFFAYFRNKYLEFEIKFPKFSWLDRIFIIVPMFFPVLSVLGAFLLNNHGPNTLTMIMLGGIAVYVFCIVLFHKKLNENVFPWAILMISISLLLSGWLRSWYISGVDTNLEFSIFQMTKEKAFWSVSNFDQVYNAMLSVTILPTILSLFAKINVHFILKLFFSLIFMFVPVIVYLISKRYFKGIICFLASLFFMSQQAFITWSAIPIRQEIAFLFFGLMPLVLFNKEINPKIRNLLFIIFGFSMIVSHYSTAYIALAIFLLTYICIFFYRRYENHKIKKGKLKPEQKEQFYLTGIIILLLLVFGFLWYSQVTTTANGLVDFMHKSISNMENMFSEDVQADGKTPFDQFNIFFKPADKNQLLEDYMNETKSNFGVNPVNESSSEYKPRIIASRILPRKVDYNLANRMYLLLGVIKILMKIFIIIGFFSTIFIDLKKRYLNYDYITMLFACFFLFGLLMILPFISIRYDLLRAYQQFLILLSSQVVLGGFFIFKFLKENYKILIITLLFLFFFLFMSGFIPQLIGGTYGSMSLNNLGSEYDMLYSHTAEVSSGKWLRELGNPLEKVYVDNRGEVKLYLSTSQLKLIEDILPLVMGHKGYAYSSYTNVKEQIAFKSFNGNILSFNFPTQFLNDNKNKIYNNGGSEIFK